MDKNRPIYLMLVWNNKMGLIKVPKDQITEYVKEDNKPALPSESFQKDRDVASSIPAISPLSSAFEAEKTLKYVNKDRRILVQGILQAVIQSQGLLLEPNEGYINKVKEVTLDLVKFVEEYSK